MSNGTQKKNRIVYACCEREAGKSRKIHGITNVNHNHEILTAQSAFARLLMSISDWHTPRPYRGLSVTR